MKTSDALILLGVVVIGCTIANLIALKVAADVASDKIDEASQTPTASAFSTLAKLIKA